MALCKANPRPTVTAHCPALLCVALLASQASSPKRSLSGGRSSLQRSSASQPRKILLYVSQSTWAWETGRPAPVLFLLYLEELSAAAANELVCTNEAGALSPHIPSPRQLGGRRIVLLMELWAHRGKSIDT